MRREWSGRRVSNPRPSAWKADALPTELLPPVRWSGRRDLNSRPPAPKAGALPGCATSRSAAQVYPMALGASLRPAALLLQVGELQLLAGLERRVAQVVGLADDVHGLAQVDRAVVVRRRRWSRGRRPAAPRSAGPCTALPSVPAWATRTPAHTATKISRRNTANRMRPATRRRRRWRRRGPADASANAAWRPGVPETPRRRRRCESARLTAAPRGGGAAPCRRARCRSAGSG